MADNEQQELFSVPKEWENHWKGMPEYEQKDLMPWQTIKVHFRNMQDRKEFATRMGQQVTDKTQFMWYPKAEIQKAIDKRHISAEPKNPRYPVYVISKGRWDSRLTSRTLEQLGVPYFVVVEPHEYEQYAAVIAPTKVLTLPFSNLGQGSIPARNWVWDHAVSCGAGRHWIMDDNIKDFVRLNQNLKVKVADGTIFRAMEDFVDRYTNVVIAGPAYHFFAKRKQLIPPFLFNTRIYSCILIKNDLEHRWRGRYNEDTDICLRALKSGYVTVQFNAFLSGKATTMTMKGGNTDELYKDDGRRLMAESLQQQHPDVVTITEKFGHVQHQVDYSYFQKNKPILRDGVTLDDGEDPYGMSVRMIGEHTDVELSEEEAALAEVERLLAE